MSKRKLLWKCFVAVYKVYNLLSIPEIFPYQDSIDDENLSEKCHDTIQVSTIKTPIGLDMKSMFTPIDSEEYTNLLKRIMDNSNLNNLKDLNRKLYSEALDSLEEECEKTIEIILTELLSEVEKLKTEAVDNAIKQITKEHNDYIQKLQLQHEKNLEQEATNIEIGLRHELEIKVEEERRSSERRMRSAMEEAQGYFREHLKMAVQEVQKEERKIRDKNCIKIKKNFEKKIRDTIQTATENKEKFLLQSKERIQKEADEELKKFKKQEEFNIQLELNQQKEKYQNSIVKLKRKLSRMETQILNLTERLKETMLKRSEAEAEMTKMKEYLGQFIKLANKTQFDSNCKINKCVTSSKTST